MRQKACHRLVYKIHTKQLKKHGWEINLDLHTVFRESPESIVALNDSQALRFIDEINGVSDVTSKVAEINRRIRLEREKPRSRETKANITQLYRILYELQFQKDYVCIIMDSNADYDRANKGFKINGIEFRRFLGTNGGIKNSTIVYVNAGIYDELKRRLDNGRSMEVPLVPAKLEAYQALICSGSIPLPPPDGIIVVDDCITRFKEDVIRISDGEGDEPILSYEKDYEIEHTDSDGYGLMLPSYSRRVNEYLTGDGEHEITGMNTRYSWEKGMLYTFDYLEFAEQVAGSFMVVDIWGQPRDLRKSEVILTGSMLKLWNCYDSWESYYENCQRNHYQFSTTKVTPDILENVRDTNYQFLQSYELDDDELRDICQPTINEVKEVLGLDYRKALVYLCGFGLNERSVLRIEDDFIKAIMIEPRMIDDPYVRRNIYSMIKKRMNCAKKGSIQVDANYAMISGDPYALCQSMCGLDVTGLLKAGDVYHKYWIDKGADEIVCFRAPMTCHNNIRKMRLSKTEEVRHWYQYIKTALVYNAWDSACEAMNGADKDGDTNMCTDNAILLRRTLNLPTIVCMQRKADKKIVNEDDIIAANKLAFNDDIGVVTNFVTSMIERQAAFEPDTPEYKELAYRIMCGQHFQQATIDRAKGVIAKSMPASWHSFRDNMVADDGEDETTIARKEFNQRIVASHKPYFMIYIYPQFKQRVDSYIKNNNTNIRKRFVGYNIHNIDELRAFEPKTKEMKDFIYYFDSQMVYGDNACVINRICRLYEKEFPPYSLIKESSKPFDYTILKSGRQYSRQNYKDIEALYQQYRHEVDDFHQSQNLQLYDNSEREYQHALFLSRFKRYASEVCSNQDELCDIVLDLCYQKEGSKQFAWDVSGSTIIRNLLKRNDYRLSFPEHIGDEFVFCGEGFSMRTVCIQEDELTDDHFE